MKLQILTSEEFKKLSQLDRIEFRQRRDEIDKYFSTSLAFFFTFLSWGWLISGLLVLLIMWEVSSSKELIILFLSLFTKGIWIWIIILIFSLLIDILFYFKKRNIIRKMEKEYKEKI